MIDDLCKSSRRDPSTLEKSWHISGVVDGDSDQVKKRLSYHENWRNQCLGVHHQTGSNSSPITRNLALAVFKSGFLDGVNLEPLKLFAREVIPKLKGMSVG